jgi:hypothetical protein
MQFRPRKSIVPAGLLAAALLAACGGPAPTPTLRPVVVTVFLTGTPAPGLAPTPTALAVVTSTPAPTAQTSAPTAAPGAVYGPDVYPLGVNPLTGQDVGPERVNRMPIAAKISNFPYSVRPQSGLALADVVFEHLAEAGLTRFTAVFLQNDAEQIGSIRSARFIDTEIAPMFGAMLVTSGSSLGTMQNLRSNPWFLGNIWRLVSEESSYSCPPLCRNNPNVPDDANALFAGTQALRAATAAQAGNTHVGQSGFVFAAETPAGGAAVSEVDLHLSPAAHVAYRFNPAAGNYTRWQEKDPSGELAVHVDALSNAPITTDNVVVLFVNHQNNFVPEDFRDGGNCGLEIQLWTIGPARVFRDGQFYDGRWHRDGSTNWRLRLEDNAGNPLVLRPGNTWFAVVGLTADSALNGATYNVTNRVLDTRSVCPVPPTETPTETPEGYVEPEVTETPGP